MPRVVSRQRSVRCSRYDGGPWDLALDVLPRSTHLGPVIEIQRELVCDDDERRELGNPPSRIQREALQRVL